MLPTEELNLQFNSACGLWTEILKGANSREGFDLGMRLKAGLLGLNSTAVKLLTATYNNSCFGQIFGDSDDEREEALTTRKGVQNKLLLID